MFAIKQCSKLSAKFNSVIKHISTSQNGSYEEIRIPVPWGYIAGKWWGPQNKRPVLGVHGWQDNSGSFDRLAPNLVSSIGFLAVDLPGHGLSSQLPPGVCYHSMDYVITLKRIVNYFNWPKVSLLGHSVGGITTYLYTVLYPNDVDFLICLDAFKPLAFSADALDDTAKRIDYFIKYDNMNSSKKEPAAYTFNELEHQLSKATGATISLDACKYILRRNVARSMQAPDKFYITRDARLRILPARHLSQEFVMESASKLKCPTFVSRCSLRTHPHDSAFNADDVVKIIRKLNEHFEYHYVEGNHHMHINNPEHLSDLINAFIKKYDVEDRLVGGLRPENKVNMETVDVE